MRFLFLFFSGLLFGNLSSLAQFQKIDTLTAYFNQLYSSVQEVYGTDQVLCNGVFYQDVYQAKIGHPFLFEDQFYRETITFKGKKYSDIDVKYDIYEQRLIVYLKNDNTVNWVILPNDFISAFTLNGKHFIRCILHDEPAFYEAIYDAGKIKCLYFWSKSRFDAGRKDLSNTVEFKYNLRKNYLILDGQLLQYRKNNSFINAFPKQIKHELKSYMNSNRIKVNSSDNNTLYELLTYADSLLSAANN